MPKCPAIIIPIIILAFCFWLGSVVVMVMRPDLTVASVVFFLGWIILVLLAGLFYSLCQLFLALRDCLLDN